MEKPNLPKKPGIYQFFSGPDILYVGKAKDLSHRVSSYFRADAPEKARRLVNGADRLETTITHNETEALLLEQRLIQSHQPPYNALLKDGVRYAYLVLQKNPLRLKTVRRQHGHPLPKGKVFGPFGKGSHRWELVRLLRVLYFQKTGRPLEKAEQQDAYALFESVLSGKTDVAEALAARMDEASKNREYEKALLYKNRLAALSALDERQVVEQKTSAHQDVIALEQDGARVSVQVFRVRYGVLAQQEKHAFESIGENPLEEFLIQYYAAHLPPKEIVLAQKVPQALLPNTRISVPKRGVAANLLRLAETNAAAALFISVPQNVLDLQKALHLKKTPRRIEGFDISTFQGAATVAGMVSFLDAKPDKAQYRHFNIHTAAAEKRNPEPDDFAAMREVVFRRYDRLRREGRTLPDLVLIDGGKGQLSAALKGMEDADVRIATVALAKEFEEMYLPGLSAPVRLPKSHAGRKLLQAVRDEVHRFSVAFHRKKREKIKK